MVMGHFVTPAPIWFYINKDDNINAGKMTGKSRSRKMSSCL